MGMRSRLVNISTRSVKSSNQIRTGLNGYNKTSYVDHTVGRTML